MRLRKIIKLFDKGNCLVFGLRGSGKDMLTANVIFRRQLPYVSNIDYGGQFFPLDFKLIDCGRNKFDAFISHKVKPYVFPYPDGTDVYLSDGGIYLPSQYCNILNNSYPYFPVFYALSRHLGNCNLHVNSQALNRVWDKIREQSDTYILCLWCKVLFKKLVFMRVRYYDNYDAALKKVKPFRLRVPLIGGSAKALIRTERERFQQNYGIVKEGFLLFKNRSTYDTRYFKTLLEGE